MRKISFAGIELTSQRVRGYMVPLLPGRPVTKSKNEDRGTIVYSAALTYSQCSHLPIVVLTSLPPDEVGAQKKGQIRSDFSSKYHGVARFSGKQKDLYGRLQNYFGVIIKKHTGVLRRLSRLLHSTKIISQCPQDRYPDISLFDRFRP